MTLKEFAYGAYLLPGTVFSGITGLLFGGYEKDENGKNKLDRLGKEIPTRGLLSLILDAAKAILRGIGNFVSNHKQAIAIAFWTSLIVGGAAALTVAFWPAALAAVVGFSIYGVSIASVVGVGFAAQVGAVAGLAFAATSVGVYISATVVNAIIAIKDFFAGKFGGGTSPTPEVEVFTPMVQFAGLKAGQTAAPQAPKSNNQQAPQHHAAPVTSTPLPITSADDSENENENESENESENELTSVPK